MKDSQFLNYLIGIVGALFGFLILMVILANLMSSDEKAQDSMVTDAINERIKPVGEVTIGAPKAAAPVAAASPKDAYQSNCFACHGTGAAGAPKLGDKAAWKARIAQGKATLFKHATGGYKGMPPRGGSSLDDAAIKGVIDYMVSQSK